MILTPQQILIEVTKLAGRGAQAAAYYYAARVKENLSVAAPRKTVTSRKGVRYYRATVPASPGAFPRKLSGRLRTSIAVSFDPSTGVGRVGTNVVYARRLEFEGHSFLLATLKAEMANIQRIVTGQ